MFPLTSETPSIPLSKLMETLNNLSLATFCKINKNGTRKIIWGLNNKISYDIGIEHCAVYNLNLAVVKRL